MGSANVTGLGRPMPVQRAIAVPTEQRGEPWSTARIDIYLLRLVARPLGLSLGLVLLALLLERMLRLFDLMATRGGELSGVLALMVSLVPHYLGLALPAAYFFSVFLVVARLAEDNEIDALQAAGVSLRRLGRVFVMLAAVLAVFSVLLFGYLQPYSRYAYRAVFYALTHVAWNATVEEGAFLQVGRGYTLYADKVEGERLSGVFVDRRREGRETVTTAETGTLGLNVAGDTLLLTLHNGTHIRTRDDGSHRVMAFDNLMLDRAFNPSSEPFRQRGDSAREMTLSELTEAWQSPNPPDDVAKLKSEFNARLARAVSILFLPLLALPMGIAAKRSQRGRGMAVAAVVLALYHHLLQLGESLGDMGAVPPALGLWLPCAAFGLGCGVLFFMTGRNPGGNPFAALFERLEGAAGWVGRLMAPKRALQP